MYAHNIKKNYTNTKKWIKIEFFLDKTDINERGKWKFNQGYFFGSGAFCVFCADKLGNEN